MGKYTYIITDFDITNIHCIYLTNTIDTIRPKQMITKSEQLFWINKSQNIYTIIFALFKIK